MKVRVKGDERGQKQPQGKVDEDAVFLVELAKFGWLMNLLFLLNGSSLFDAHILLTAGADIFGVDRKGTSVALFVCCIDGEVRFWRGRSDGVVGGGSRGDGLISGVIGVVDW